VEHDGCSIVLDMGNGSLGALQRYTDIYSLGGVVISHLHVDHFIDLCSYYVARRFRPDGQIPPVPVWGPQGTMPRLRAAYGLSGRNDMEDEFAVRDLADRFTIGPFTITTAPMQHPVPSRAIRVEAAGKSVTYSADTGPTPQLVELARGTDVALFEASFLEGEDNPPDLHLTGREAAEHAREAGAGALILTHLVPWYDSALVLAEARDVDAGAELARPGMSVDL
jgi:ribonuclease BN (tRNA processing enzyme)